MIGWLLSYELDGRGRKRWLSNLSYCAVMCLEGLRKTTSVRIAGIRTEIRTSYLSNMQSDKVLVR
jgi:hypothetical protein